jgi:hypothetical protein
MASKHKTIQIKIPPFDYRYPSDIDEGITPYNLPALKQLPNPTTMFSRCLMRWPCRPQSFSSAETLSILHQHVFPVLKPLAIRVTMFPQC